MLFQEIKTQIENLDTSQISNERKTILQELIDYIKEKINSNKDINLNFICTHNSRRSHLSQVWAQALAFYYNNHNVTTYSGGTEATALYQMAVQALETSGFKIKKISNTSNPIYSIKYADNEHPMIGFSKTYDDDFNPKSEFAAIMTCSSADQGCPIVLGAEKRIALTFEDPKAFDDTPIQKEKYIERSLQIATELKYVFENIDTRIRI